MKIRLTMYEDIFHAKKHKCTVMLKYIGDSKILNTSSYYRSHIIAMFAQLLATSQL